MKYLSIFALLFFLCSCGTNKTNTPRKTVGNHPIIGTWGYTKNGCEELYTFDDLGNRFVESNEEIVVAKYSLTPINSSKGVFLLRDEVVEDNGKPDCSGSTSVMVGDIVEVIVFFETSPSRFSFCFDDELSDCAGPFFKKK